MRTISESQQATKEVAKGAGTTMAKTASTTTTAEAAAGPRTTLRPTTVKADHLLKYVFGDSVHDKNENSSNKDNEKGPQPPARLQGRPVLIPLGSRAFVEGELRPHRRRRTTTTKTSNDNATNVEEEGEEEELVEVVGRATSDVDTATTTTSTTMSTTEAIQWLRKHSSSSKAPTTPKRTTRKLVADAATAASNSTKTSTKSSPSTNLMGLLPNLMDIQEEYDDKGRQVSAQAVDISAQLKALWKLNSAGENKEEEMPTSVEKDDDGDTHTAVTGSDDTATVSDEEYNKLSQRLEELARLEEAEEGAKRNRGRKQHDARTTTTKKSKQSQQLQFKKGFLNAGKAPSSLSSQKKNTSNKNHETTVAAPTRKRNTTITIDTSKNTVQTIPREGRQQPVQPKPQRQQQEQLYAPPHRPLVDEKVFSGQIQEHTLPENLSSAVGSNAAATTTVHTVSQVNKKKSRFAQERQRN